MKAKILCCLCICSVDAGLVCGGAAQRPVSDATSSASAACGEAGRGEGLSGDARRRGFTHAPEPWGELLPGWRSSKGAENSVSSLCDDPPKSRPPGHLNLDADVGTQVTAASDRLASRPRHGKDNTRTLREGGVREAVSGGRGVEAAPPPHHTLVPGGRSTGARHSQEHNQPGSVTPHLS
ncbi:hypothetical protein O3P69_018000 [Scylla paramamosain]|uniref:Secreted protein n=1 Tax=Scylla paramamosain TaxID=85552 RepID=A0AAW0TKS0_SCYPA